jgi:hypothetical protein
VERRSALSSRVGFLTELGKQISSAILFYHFIALIIIVYSLGLVVVHFAQHIKYFIDVIFRQIHNTNKKGGENLFEFYLFMDQYDHELHFQKLK